MNNAELIARLQHQSRVASIFDDVDLRQLLCNLPPMHWKRHRQQGSQWRGMKIDPMNGAPALTQHTP